MVSSNDISLPQLFFHFSDTPGNEKLVIGPIAPGLHITIHFGTKSKILDVHITDEINDDYKTLLRIKHTTLLRIIVRLKQIFNSDEMFMFFNETINLGKLKKNRCCLQQLSDSELLPFAKINKNKTKLKLKKNIPKEVIYKMYKRPDEIENVKSTYLVYRTYRNRLRLTGILYNFPSEKYVRRKYIFLNKKKFRSLFSHLKIKCFEALSECDPQLYDEILKLESDFQLPKSGLSKLIK